MFLHPRMPTYEDQLAARDRMLAQHPDANFCAAHLASLEWSVDELARFLDRFPMSVAETAARVADLQFQSSQDHAKVRDFLIKHQDRILTQFTQSHPTNRSPDPHHPGKGLFLRLNCSDST